MKMNPTKSVHRIHFEDFSGSQFERLVFAYHVRLREWPTLEWYGQTGSDLGRDIWGETEVRETLCIQCVNRERLTHKKICDDLTKVLRAPKGVPDHFRVITRADVSSTLRDKIKKHVEEQGAQRCDVWSGSEFEEFLRAKAESLLKRFVEGEVFPDAEAELIAFVNAREPASKELTLEMALSMIEAYRNTIRGFLGGSLPPLVQDAAVADRGQKLIDTLLKPTNWFLIGPSGAAKTFHLQHLAVSMVNGNSEIPILVNANVYRRWV